MSAWTLLLCLVVALFAAMKMAVLIAVKPRLDPPHLAAFLFWPGMHPRPFMSPGPPRMSRFLAHLPGGLVCLGAGTVLMAGAGWLAGDQRGSPWLFVAGLPGLSLVFHFGLLRLWTGVLQSRGYAVRILFPNPFLSTSLSDFWANRWNRAYSELMTLLFHRPLADFMSPLWALLLTFLISGLLHEWAISLPVGSGYGGPTLYFMIQGAATWGLPLVARKMGPSIPIRALVYAVVLIPLPLVFHSPFVEGIVHPATRLAARVILP